MVRGLIVALACVAAAGTSGATTYLLHPDGTGDFPNLQAALAGSIDGDVIELSDGTYSGAGNHDIDFLGRAVTVRRQSWARAWECTIDLTGNGGFLFNQAEGPESVLEGIAMVNGYRHDGGGAILLISASPTIRDCIFSGNEGYSGGGGILCYAGSHPNITGCQFTQCLSVYGGGLCCIDASAPVVVDCAFENNTTSYGGAVAAYNGSAPALTNCRLTGNHAWTDGGALLAEGSAQMALTGCTLDANDASMDGIVTARSSSTISLLGCTLAGNAGTACLWVGTGATMILDRTIVAFEIDGAAVHCEDIEGPSLTCCDIFGNAGGDWTECIAGQLGAGGNLSADPLFCDPLTSDWTLHADSPCGPTNPDCGLIGAWPVGCGPSPAEPTSWGAVKARFLR